MKLLLIEDDFATASAVQAVLHAAGDRCDATQSGQRGVELAESGDYQAIILDLLLPDLDGMAVLEKMRAADIKTPVLMLSGVGDVTKKIDCFRAGADDYLVKPFESAELMARLSAIVRRGSTSRSQKICVGRLSVDTEENIAKVDEKPLALTNKEFSILKLIATRRGRAVSKSNIYEHLYPNSDAVRAKIIDVFICKIRSKLKAATGGEDYIQTVWGRGYTLRKEDNELDEGKAAKTEAENANIRMSAALNGPAPMAAQNG